jgi:hypothetical protein
MSAQPTAISKAMPRPTRRGGLFALAAAALIGAACLAPAPAAAAAPAWELSPLSDTTAQPGQPFHFYLSFRNVGDAPTAGDYKLTAHLPGTMTAVSTESTSETNLSCPGAAGASTFECTATDVVGPQRAAAMLNIEVNVPAAPLGAQTAMFELSGGGAATAESVDPVTVSSTVPGFGLDSFDAKVDADAGGTPLTTAGAHPYASSTAYDLNLFNDTEFWGGDISPVAPLKDLSVELPPGLLGNLSDVNQCAATALGSTYGQANSTPTCDPSSQVGAVLVRIGGQGIAANLYGPLAVYNMVPPAGKPAMLGFALFGSMVVIELSVRSESDYGVTAKLHNVPEGLVADGSTLTLWGVPSDSVHLSERSCPGEKPPFESSSTCPSSALPKPLLRNPTSCTEAGEGTVTTARAYSWFNPGVFDSRTSVSHAAPGYPYPPSEWGPEVGIEDCASVPFEPSFSVQPTTNAADSPSGLAVDISVPQGCWEADEFASTCQSDLRNAHITLPQGMTLNPAAADGLAACSPAQVGLTTPLGSAPIHFNEAPDSCPDASRIGTVSIETPLLSEDLRGSIYLAEQGHNPFNSMLAIYLVAEGSGVVVKQAGKIEIGNDGRITTSFEEAPQTPFSNLHVQLFGGPRAALKTPPSCAGHTSQASLAPWSGNAPSQLANSFQITSGPGGAPCPSGGFSPKLEAGTTNPLAGQTSPFALRLTREDGTQELAALSGTLPPGLSGFLNGIPYCPDSALAAVSEALGTGAAQEASPSCPAASQLGTLTVGAGAGPNPFYTSSGRAYLAGPYKGAPLSIAVIAPAVAGPFDLGSVLVRNALRIDPETAQVSVASDPFPTALHGIPLDLRDVRVQLDRPHFTLNPTSCDEMQVASTVTSVRGATANLSNRFQVAGCEALAFKPRLSFKLKGKTNRGGNPALTAVLTARPGDANIGRVVTAFPRSEFLDQGHIKTICTRVQFAAGAGNGAGCPAGSVYGHVTAISPIVDYALEGNVYLRSSPDHELPDLVLALHGPPSQPVAVSAVGRIDSIHGGIRSSFEAVPDVPLTKVVLSMGGGKKGLLENSTNICKATHRVRVQMDGQNGKAVDSAPALKASCPKTHKRHRKAR